MAATRPPPESDALVAALVELGRSAAQLANEKDLPALNSRPAIPRSAVSSFDRNDALEPGLSEDLERFRVFEGRSGNAEKGDGEEEEEEEEEFPDEDFVDASETFDDEKEEEEEDIRDEDFMEASMFSENEADRLAAMDEITDLPLTRFNEVNRKFLLETVPGFDPDAEAPEGEATHLEELPYDLLQRISLEDGPSLVSTVFVALAYSVRLRFAADAAAAAASADAADAADAAVAAPESDWSPIPLSEEEAGEFLINSVVAGRLPFSASSIDAFFNSNSPKIMDGRLQASLGFGLPLVLMLRSVVETPPSGEKTLVQTCEEIFNEAQKYIDDDMSARPHKVEFSKKHAVTTEVLIGFVWALRPTFQSSDENSYAYTQTYDPLGATLASPTLRAAKAAMGEQKRAIFDRKQRYNMLRTLFIALEAIVDSIIKAWRLRNDWAREIEGGSEPSRAFIRGYNISALSGRLEKARKEYENVKWTRAFANPDTGDARTAFEKWLETNGLEAEKERNDKLPFDNSAANTFLKTLRNVADAAVRIRRWIAYSEDVRIKRAIAEAATEDPESWSAEAALEDASLYETRAEVGEGLGEAEADSAADEARPLAAYSPRRAPRALPRDAVAPKWRRWANAVSAARVAEEQVYGRAPDFLVTTTAAALSGLVIAHNQAADGRRRAAVTAALKNMLGFDEAASARFWAVGTEALAKASRGRNPPSGPLEEYNSFRTAVVAALTADLRDSAVFSRYPGELLNQRLRDSALTMPSLQSLSEELGLDIVKMSVLPITSERDTLLSLGVPLEMRVDEATAEARAATRFFYMQSVHEDLKAAEATLRATEKEARAASWTARTPAERAASSAALEKASAELTQAARRTEEHRTKLLVRAKKTYLDIGYDKALDQLRGRVPRVSTVSYLQFDEFAAIAIDRLDRARVPGVMERWRARLSMLAREVVGGDSFTSAEVSIIDPLAINAVVREAAAGRWRANRVPPETSWLETSARPWPRATSLLFGTETPNEAQFLADFLRAVPESQEAAEVRSIAGDINAPSIVFVQIVTPAPWTSNLLREATAVAEAWHVPAAAWGEEVATAEAAVKAAAAEADEAAAEGEGSVDVLRELLGFDMEEDEKNDEEDEKKDEEEEESF